MSPTPKQPKINTIQPRLGLIQARIKFTITGENLCKETRFIFELGDIKVDGTVVGEIEDGVFVEATFQEVGNYALIAKNSACKRSLTDVVPDAFLAEAAT